MRRAIPPKRGWGVSYSIFPICEHPPSIFIPGTPPAKYMDVVTSRELNQYPGRYIRAGRKFVVTNRGIKAFVVTIEPYKEPNVVTTRAVGDMCKVPGCKFYAYYQGLCMTHKPASKVSSSQDKRKEQQEQRI